MKRKKSKVSVPLPEPEPVPPEIKAAEQAHFVETLKANQQLADEGKPLPPGATHQIATGAKGRQQVVRRRFSEI